MAEVEDVQEDESLKIYEEAEEKGNGTGDDDEKKGVDKSNEDESDSLNPEHLADTSIPDTIEDYAPEHCDSTTASMDKTGVKTSSEPLIDYAKNTMNSFLSMYGYEESVTTETIKSKIKSEPSSPQQQQQEILGEKSANLSEGFSLTSGGEKIDNTKKHLVNSSPRTATVLPLQSTAKPKIENGFNPGVSSGLKCNVGNTPATLHPPRKPVTPYMRYRNMIFEEIKHKFPGCSPYDLACLISSKWSMLTDSERKVWEDQYEQEVREYSVHLKEYSDSLKNAYKNDPPAATASATNTVSKMGSPEETKTAVRRGSCNWCKKQAVLLDFSSVLDGREIYCTGLCSDKCFTEAAKQIVTIENGSTKPRYISGSRSQSSSREDVRVPSFAAPASHFPPPSATTPGEGPVVAPPAPPPPFQVFDWDRYLAETRSSAAPWLYFKQSRYPPSNNFVVGMKLEACNGQTMIGYSLATVVAISGARILLHFDGSDASSDIWRLPDSGDIHPVGWTEASQLKPPTGYKYDTTKYRRFHASSLQNAEIAPARLFKKEPRAPIENYFIAGMKLEAVLKQNPAVIGVASIRDTDEERIHIEFDGCKGTGYWTHYTDRDLFPAGWCSRSGHPLKPPGNVDTKAYMAAVTAQGSCSPSMVSSTSAESRSSSGSPYVIYPSQQTSTITSAPPPQKESSSSTWKEKNGNNNVEIFINTDCYCGPYLDSRRVERMQHVYRGSIVTVLKSVLEETIRCAVDSKTVFGFLKPGRGNCIVTAQCDGMTYQCCLNSIDRVSTFWRVLEQFSDNLRCCPNLFSSVDYRHACNRCHRSKNSSVGGDIGSHHGSGKSSSNVFSSNGSRMKSNENIQTLRQQDNHFELSSSTGYERERNRDEHENLIRPRYEFHSESLRQDADIRHHEISRQESSRENSLLQETLRHTLHQDAMASTSRADSLSQDSTRAEMSRSEALELNSPYEPMRQESYSSEGSKDEVFHTREDSKEDLFHNNQSPSAENNCKRDLDRENTPVDITGSSPPEKKKRIEKCEVSGVEILTPPKTWTIPQVIEFIEQTDLNDNVDKFRDNEIDGKALLLLKRDLVLSHMGFKLGPAVKLLDVIDELRIVQDKFV